MSQTSHITPHLTIRDLLHWPGTRHQAHVTQCRLCNENFELQLRVNVATLHHFSKVSHELEDCILYLQNSCSLRCDHDMVGTCSCRDTETSDMSNGLMGHFDFLNCCVGPDSRQPHPDMQAMFRVNARNKLQSNDNETTCLTVLRIFPKLNHGLKILYSQQLLK